MSIDLYCLPLGLAAAGMPVEVPDHGDPWDLMRLPGG
jgi:hypothetical protein